MIYRERRVRMTIEHAGVMYRLRLYKVCGQLSKDNSSFSACTPLSCFHFNRKLTTHSRNLTPLRHDDVHFQFELRFKQPLSRVAHFQTSSYTNTCRTYQVYLYIRLTHIDYRRAYISNEQYSSIPTCASLQPPSTRWWDAGIDRFETRTRSIEITSN